VEFDPSDPGSGEIVEFLCFGCLKNKLFGTEPAGDHFNRFHVGIFKNNRLKFIFSKGTIFYFELQFQLIAAAVEFAGDVIVSHRVGGGILEGYGEFVVHGDVGVSSGYACGPGEMARPRASVQISISFCSSGSFKRRPAKRCPEFPSPGIRQRQAPKPFVT